MIKYIIYILILLNIGCVTEKFNFTTGTRYDLLPEPSYGIEIEAREERAGAIMRLGVSYTEPTTWGQQRIVIKPGYGFWLRPYEDFFIEPGVSVHLIPYWSSGTWAEIVPHVRFGYEYKDWIFWTEVNRQASNADLDTFGEHPRRPGFGVAFGITRKW